MWMAGIEVNFQGAIYLECDTCHYRSERSLDKLAALDAWNREQEARIEAERRP